MTTEPSHYLKTELYQRVQNEPAIFDFLQAGALDGLWYLDLEHPEHEWMNDRFWEVLGYDPAQKKPLTSEWQDLIFKDDLAKAMAALEHHLADPQSSYDEIVRYHHAAGATVWIRCRGIAIRDQDGKPVRMLGAHTDVSDLMRARLEQERTSAMLDKIRRAQAGVIVKGDTKQAFELMLDTLLEGTGSEYGFIGEVLTREDGMPILKSYATTNIAWDEATRDLYRQEAEAGMAFLNLETLFEAVMTTGGPVFSNAPGKDPRWGDQPRGRPAMSSFMGLPLFHGETMVGMVGVANRVGGYEEALSVAMQPFLQSCTNLIMVLRNERTRRLAERERLEVESELRAAKEAAEASALAAKSANTAKSRFLTTMSHEIRTPLNAILGMAQLLKMPNVDDEKRIEFAQIIAGSGDALLSLLNDILDLAKIEEGKFQIEMDHFDAADVLRDTAQLFESAAREKGVALATSLGDPIAPQYRGDSVRLRQMLNNLIGNAVKFTDAGAIEVTLREVSRAEHEAVLEFSVSDTGIGIHHDHLSLLFQPFSQLDGGMDRRHAGTGLGLYLVRNLATLMGGEVGVESEPCQGSRFWFRVGVGLVGEDTGPKSESERAGAAGPLNGIHVLVADDNVSNCLVVENMLDHLGCIYTVVTDGVEALSRATAEPRPDVILMDCRMPRMDGYQATAAIREWEQEGDTPPVPIIALTAHAFDDNRQRCLDLGMNDFLTKPVRLLDLTTVITRHTVGGLADT